MRIDLEVLWEEVERVKATLPSDNMVEVLTTLAYKGGKLLSFNGSTGTITPTVLDDLGDFCVPGKKWCSILSAVKGDGEGTITFADDWLHVRAGLFSTKIPVIRSEDYPDISPTNVTEVVSTPDLVDALRATLVFMEKDASKGPILNVGFFGGHAYSTDRRRVTRSVVGDFGKPLTITQEAASQIVRLGNPDFLGTCKGMLVAHYAQTNTTVISRQSASPFPFSAFEKVFQQDIGAVAEIPASLRAAVDRVVSFAEDEEGTVVLEATGDHLKIFTADTEKGGASDAVKFDSPIFRVKLKGSSLRACLRQLKPSHVDLTDIVSGEGRQVVFSGPKFQCAFAVMV